MINIFFKMKEQYIKTELEYPFNFWMMMVAGVVTRVIGILVPFIIYSNIPSIGGWKREEIYMIMAFLYIADGLCSVLFEGIWMLPDMVFHGQFDSILSRPVSPLFQVLANGMGLQGIANTVCGIAILVYSMIKLDKVSLLNVLICVFSIICGTIIYVSVALLGNSIVFLFDSGGRSSIAYAIVNIGHYAKYPGVIYPKVIRFLLLFLIPFSFIGEVPARVIRGENIMLYVFFLFIMTIIFAFLAKLFFYKGISKYESVGM